MSGESEWTVGMLRALVEQQFRDQRLLLDERYATQTKALDAAFASQQVAMQTALTAAERAVATAMVAAEKATIKAETAADKRFEAVNEFRGQLADQARTFLPRAEATAVTAVLAEKIDNLATRIDKAEGRGAGLNAGWVYLLAGLAAAGTIVSVYLALKGG